MNHILCVMSCFFIYVLSIGQVTITKPSTTFSACSYPSNYTNLGTITISETNNSDIAVGNNQTFTINAPANFEFEPNVGAISILPGGNLKSESISITNQTVTITYSCTNTNRADGIIISGLKIRVLSPTSSTFKRTGGNAVINGLSVGTSITNTITGQTLPANSYRSVTNAVGPLNWNSSSTWECGIIPPNDGTADVFISAYNDGYTVLNAVVFGNNNIKSLTIESGASLTPPSGSGSTLVVNGDFKIQSGGYLVQYNWISNGKNAIEIKGNFTNNGEMTTTGSNNMYDLDISFNGTSAQTISGTGIFRMISNGSQMSTLTFNNPKGIILNTNFSTQGLYGDAGSVVVNGLLMFGNSSNQFTGGGSLTMNGTVVLKATTFYGHFANSGTKTLGANSTIEYTNSSSIISSANIPSLNLYRLISNVGSGGTISVSENLSISNQLTLNSGNINLGTNTLTIGTSISNTGTIAYNSGLIMGKVKRWFSSTNSGNESGLFPLGANGKSKFIKVEYTQATDGGTITAEWIPTAMGSNYTNELISTTCNGSFEIYNTASGYWSMTPGDGITNVENKKYNITLNADGLLDFTNDCFVTALKREGSNPWIQSGIHIDNIGDAISPNVQRIGATGWSNWGLAGGSGNPLPVELSSFALQCEENGTLVTWKTESEFNSLSFEIDQSEDGIQWNPTASISAAGTSNEELVYNFFVERSNEINYFRLRQLDINGDEKIYGPIANNCSSHFQVSTFPNPSDEEFNLLVRANKVDEYGMLRIIDINGRILHEKSLSLQVGINIFHIAGIDSISKGTYYINISGSGIETQVLKHIIK